MRKCVHDSFCILGGNPLKDIVNEFGRWLFEEGRVEMIL